MLINVSFIKVIASVSSSSNNIQVMNDQLNSTILYLVGHSGPVNWLKILPDGRMASASNDMTIILWNLTTNMPNSILTGHTGQVKCLELLTNGYLISGASDNSTRVWDTATNKSVCTINNAHNGTVNVIKLLYNCQLATGSADGIIKIWNVSTWTSTNTLTGHTASIFGLEPLLDGTLASGSNDGTLKIWNITSGAILNNFTPFGGNNVYAIKEITYRFIAVGGWSSNLILFYQINGANSQTLVKTITPSSNVVSIFRMTLLYPILYATGQDYIVMVNVSNSSNILSLPAVQIQTGGLIITGVISPSINLFEDFRVFCSIF